MKKTLSLISAFLLLFSLCTHTYSAEIPKPEIQAASAILVDAKSGYVLYEKDADLKCYPASTTKIMTALLAIEKLDTTAIATASEAAVDVDRDGSNMGILAREVLTVEQLLYGLLVHSANDAANVLAEEVSGSIEAFVADMNIRAAELGMTGTHFVNPHGYHDDNHYTTARDLSLLAKEAMKNELFAKIVSTPTYEIPPTNRYTEIRYLSNNNSLINPMKGRKYLYTAATGIKTGHTSAAGNCLVSSAEKDGASYVCVVLKAPNTDGINYSFADTITLFDWGFDNFKMQTISDIDEIMATKEVKWAKKGAQAILTAKEPLNVLLPRGYSQDKLVKTLNEPEKITAPVKEGETVGSITYSYDGRVLGEIELINKKTVKRSFFRMIFGTLISWILSIWVMGPLGIIAALLLILRYRELKRQSRRRSQRKYANRRNFYQ